MEALLQQQRALEEKDSGDTIRVLVRVRPPNERELSQVSRSASPPATRAARAALIIKCFQELTGDLRAQGFTKCVESNASGGAITVAGKTFSFDTVADEKSSQARLKPVSLRSEQATERTVFRPSMGVE